jgi:hypothetical protein
MRVDHLAPPFKNSLEITYFLPPLSTSKAFWMPRPTPDALMAGEMTLIAFIWLKYKDSGSVPLVGAWIHLEAADFCFEGRRLSICLIWPGVFPRTS